MSDSYKIYYTINNSNEEPTNTAKLIHGVEKTPTEEGRKYKYCEEYEDEDYSVYQNKKDRFLSHYL
jgi:hypothetical protein